MPAPVAGTSYVGSGYGVATAQITGVSCTGSNRGLFVRVCQYDPSGASTPAVSFKSVPMTHVIDVQTGGMMVSVFWMTAPSTGAGAVDISFVPDTVTYAASAIPISDVDQTIPYQTPATASGNSTAISVTDNNGFTGNLEIDAVVGVAGSSSLTLTAGGSQTSLSEEENINTILCAAVSTKAGASSVTMAWTIGDTAFWGTIALSLNAVGSGGTGGATPPLISGINPSSHTADNIDIVLEGCTISGSNFDIQLSGGDASVGFSGSGVTAQNVVITSPTVITLDIAIASGASVGARTVTVTTDDGAATTTFAITNPVLGGGMLRHPGMTGGMNG